MSTTSRAVARVALALLVVSGAAARAGPVEVYLEGSELCPRDRPANAPVLTEGAAIQRAQAMLPRGYCALTRFVAGCNADAELIEGTWRIFLQQYQLRGYRRDSRGLAHTYVILDPVGNCLAHMPGTELGGRE